MFQVPEDLLSILDDETFSNPSDVTTKEILKRYGEIGANGVPTYQTEPEASSPSGRTGKGRALAPVMTRVDTDSNQTMAWQKESSARMGEPSAPYPGGSNQNTPPHQWQNPELEAPLPYVQRNGNGTPDSHDGRREYRNSGWGRSQNGSVGVTGAT